MKTRIYSTLIMVIVAIAITGCGDNKTVAVKPEIEKIEETTVKEAPASTTVETKEVEEKTSKDSSSFYVDGAFYPKAYAAQFNGFKEYDSTPSTDCFSITCDGTEYFIISQRKICLVYYTDGERCYCSGIEDPSAKESQECQIKTSEVICGDLNVYLNSITAILDLTAKGDGKNMKNWEFPGITYSYTVFDCEAIYRNDGFIDAHNLNNVNDAESFIYRQK